MTRNPKRRSRPTPSRWLKIHKIGQAHLAPGMCLHKWQAILNRHGVGDGRYAWQSISDETIDQIIAEIATIVRQNPQPPSSGPPPVGGVRGVNRG